MDSMITDNCFYLFGKNLERRSSISSVATEDSGYSSIFRIVNSIRVYSSKDEYLVAMIEDLAIWLQSNHSISINIDNFFDILETGVLLCKQAKMVQIAGEQFIVNRNNFNRLLPGKWSNCYLQLPIRSPSFKSREIMQTFLARDNIANFIGWLREFGFSDSIMFETEDLISRKNIRHVVLALLELARIGGLFGLNVPSLIELEQEIDAEISTETETTKDEEQLESFIDASCQTCDKTKKTIRRKNSNSFSENPIPFTNSTAESDSGPKHVIQPKPYFPECDIRSLDEMVREILLECECDPIFPMTRLSEGKYLFGEKDLLIFVRILRKHVMVRVGGGWDTLNHLLYKNDPCRKDKPQGTMQVNAINKRDVRSSYSRSTPEKNVKSVRSKIMQSSQAAGIDELSSKLSNIPTSYSRKSCTNNKSIMGKVKRRSSIQLPFRPEQISTPRVKGSKIPVLSYKNLNAIKELPITKFKTNFEDITETSSAPCSRHQSPILSKRNLPKK